MLRSLLDDLAGWLETDTRLDRLAGPVQRTAAALLPRRRWGGVLSGTWLKHPLHPLLVATPIGCWTSASALDLIGERRAAQTLVGLGVLSVVPTAFSGLSDWTDTADAERRAGFVHLSANAAATAVYAASWWARRRGHHGRGVGLAALGASWATAAGWIGGHLSYAMGVGVDTNAFDGGPIDWAEVQVPSGSVPRAGVAGGVSLLVVGAADGAPHVLANRCSHRGGPLSDGHVTDGCVTCPWHASRFDVRSGAVRRGPAVAPQPVYETRVRDGELQVRRPEFRALRANSIRPETLTPAEP